MRLDEYARHDATALTELLNRGDVTSAQLQECALDAHALVHDQINAVVEVHRQEESDLPAEGPMAGVPTMVKDLFHGQVGLPCGNGSRLSKDWMVSQPTQIYARTAAAGMFSVGRTTTSEFGILGTTETIAQGKTRSPWSLDHIAGGSSGGAGAVVSAGVVPVALASDGGGSIRIPAAACGVVGLKPSRGRVPWGLHSKEPLLGWAVQFVTTRTVRDTALLLDVLSGPTPYDRSGLPRPAVPFTQSLQARPATLRIAWWADPWSGHEPDPVVAAATEATASHLEHLGHQVELATPQFDWPTYLQAMTDVWAATNASTVDRLAEAVGVAVNEDAVEGSTLAMVEYGRQVSALDLLRAIDVETHLTYLMAEFFNRFDILLTPTLGATLPPIGHYDPHAYLEPQEMFSAWSRWESFLPAFNTTGQPAISLPLHHDSAGLPIGMQLVADVGREALLLGLAAQLEESMPWSDRLPPVHASRA